jgi:hypothetical protein
MGWGAGPARAALAINVDSSVRETLRAREGGTAANYALLAAGARVCHAAGHGPSEVPVACCPTRVPVPTGPRSTRKQMYLWEEDFSPTYAATSGRQLVARAADSKCADAQKYRLNWALRAITSG